MNRLFTWVKVLFALGMFSIASVSSAQKIYSGNFSWLGHDYTDVPAGINTPTGASTADAKAAYELWWDNYIVNAKDNSYRVKWDDFAGFTRGSAKNSVSEGIAYGLLLSAYAGDQVTFDKLLKYYKLFPHYNTIHNVNTSIMNWKTCNPSTSQAYTDADGSCSDGSTIGTGGATDAEFDVAMACIVASYQWPTNTSYESFATTLIQQMRMYEFTSDGHMKPGDGWRDDEDITNISYFSPAYYRVFKEYDDPAFWDKAISACYTTLEAAANSNGLVADWTTRAGGESSIAASKGYEKDGKAFLYDAVRTPLRISLDYLWSKDARAKAYCENATAFAQSKGGVAALEAGYYLNGSAVYPGSNNNATFAGCFAVGGMAGGDASFMNTAYNELKSINPGYGHYFDETIKTISLFIMTGNMFPVPPCTAEKPDLGETKSLCNTTSLSSDITADSYEWFLGTESISTSNSISIDEAGVYTLFTKQGGCPQSDKVEIVSGSVTAEFIAQPGAGSVFLTNTSYGGISNYSWEMGGTEIATTKDHTLQGLAAGVYTVKLTVDNSEFGCSDVDFIEKDIAVGEGDGWALDDFNDYDYSWTWLKPGASNFSYGGDLNGDGTSSGPGDFDCSMIQVNCGPLGANDEYDPFGVVFKEPKPNKTCSDDAALDVKLDMGKAPYVSMRIMSSTDTDLGIAINDGSNSSDRKVETLEAGVWKTVSLNYTGFDWTDWSTGSAVFKKLDSTQIQQVQFYPYSENTSYEGEIHVDWIVAGATALPKPIFDYKKDADGKDVYVEDGTGDTWPISCSEDGGELKYIRVPDWEKEISSCTEKTKITVNSCTANEVRWFNGTTYLGSGNESPSLSGGKYYVELINDGGVTRDSVEISAAGDPFVQFTAEAEDFGYAYRFKPTTSDVDSIRWDYGVPGLAPSFPEALYAEEGYQYYGEDYLGEEITVTLTGFNKDCGTQVSTTKKVTIDCVQDPYSFTLTSSSHEIVSGTLTDTIKTCGGVEVSVSADAGSPLEDITDYAAWYGFADSDEMSTTADVVFTPTNSANYLKITTDNKCGDKVEDSIYIEVTPQIVAEVMHDETLSEEGQADNDAPLYNVFTTTWAGDDATYKWYVGTELVPAATGNEAHIDFFNYGRGSHTVKVVVSGTCGDAEDALVFEACSPEITPTFTTGDNYLEVQLFIDDYQSDYYDYSWVIEGEANPIAATSFEYAHTFAIAGDYDITLVANNGCADSESAIFTYTASENCTPNEADFTASVSGATVDLDIDAPNDGVTYTWTIESASSTIEGETASYTFTETGVYTVSVTADNGCDVKESSQDVEVCVPVTDVTVGEITGSDEVLSSDAPVFYSVANIVGATYSWTTPSGWLVSGTSTNEIEVSTVGVSGDVSVSVTNACSSPVSTSLMVITSDPISDIALTANQNGVEGGASNGGGISASVDYAGGNADDEIAWTVNGSPAGTGSTLDFPMDDADDIEVCVTISNGVTSSSQQCKTIDVKNNCETKLGAIGDITGVSEACEGTDVSLSLAAVTNADTYSWTSTTGSIVGTDNNATLSLGTTNTVVTVVIQSLNDCGSSEVTKTVSVITAPTAPANANFVASNEAGKTITFTAEDYKPEFDYEWSFTGGTPTSGTGETATTSFPTYDQSYDVTLKISGSPECSNYAGDTKTIPYELLECATPVDKSAEITLENKPCEDLYGIYSVPTDANAKSYTWTLPSGSSIAQGDNTHQVVVNYGKVDGVISVEIEGLGTCEENSHTASLDLYTPSKNNAAFTSSVASEAVADLYDVTLTANQQSELLTYSWTIATDEEDAPVSPLGSGLSEEMESLALGTYEVCLTVSGGYCDSEEKSDCNPVFITVNGLYDELNDYTTNVYPTVASNEVIVELKGDLSGEYSINVLDMTGNTVATDAMRGGDVKVLNVSDLSSGMYLIQVSQGSQTFTRKIVKD